MGREHESDSDDTDETATVQMHYDWTTIEPSMAIVETIAAVAACRPTDVNPLFEVTDPDAIDALVTPARKVLDGDVSVSFRFDAHEVTVRGDGTVSVSSNTAESETTGSDS